MVPQLAKLLRKERLLDAVLCRPAREILAGAFGAGEADLGSGLFKKRMARLGAGKSDSYRAIIAYGAPHSDRVLVAYAFAKNAALKLPRSCGVFACLGDYGFVVAVSTCAS